MEVLQDLLSRTLMQPGMRLLLHRWTECGNICVLSFFLTLECLRQWKESHRALSASWLLSARSFSSSWKRRTLMSCLLYAQWRPHRGGKPVKTRGRGSEWTTEEVLDQADGRAVQLDQERVAIVQDARSQHWALHRGVCRCPWCNSLLQNHLWEKKERPPPKVHWVVSSGRWRNVLFHLWRMILCYCHKVISWCCHLCKIRTELQVVFMLVWIYKANGLRNILSECNLFVNTKMSVVYCQAVEVMI